MLNEDLNIQVLSLEEISEIRGGASFGYRAGQLLRYGWAYASAGGGAMGELAALKLYIEDHN